MFNATRASAILLVTFAAFGCGEGEVDNTQSEDEYGEVIPSTSTLALQIDEDGEADPEGVDPPALKAKTQAIFDRVNDAVAATHERLDAMKEGIEPQTTTIGNFECKRWTKAGEAVEWRLTSCKRDLRNRSYGFHLQGRALDSEDEFRTVAKGHGKRMARFDGAKRGAGRIGYNFDARYALLGRGPTGKVGFGYRHVGAKRVLNVGLKDFQRANAETPISAVYKYKQLVGTGGRVRLKAHADFITAADGFLELGRDGLVEKGRIAIGWKRGVGARAAAVICGGSVGEGECVRVKRCWSVGELSLDELGDAPNWERAACPEPAFAVEEAPAEGDLEVPDADGDLPGPAMEEPADE